MLLKELVVLVRLFCLEPVDGCLHIWDRAEQVIEEQTPIHFELESLVIIETGYVAPTLLLRAEFPNDSPQRLNVFLLGNTPTGILGCVPRVGAYYTRHWPWAVIYNYPSIVTVTVHEVLHDLGATHDRGVMRPYLPVTDIFYITDRTKAQLRRSFRRYKRGVNASTSR